MRRGPIGMWAAMMLACSAAAGVPALAQSVAVDLELVLAVDISRSMDSDEQHLQRLGYTHAFLNQELLQAVRTGPLRRIAVTYVEWAGTGLQTQVMPWTLIDSEESAKLFALRLQDIPAYRQRRTSISDALLYAASLFPANGFSSGRQVIDISGDGPNNQGVRVTDARDQVLQRGIVINGLPIMLKQGMSGGFFNVDDLDLYYEDCVIGGVGSFLIRVRAPHEFASAIRRKLILEIAGAQPRVMPAQFSAPSLEPTDCLIGEKLWDAWINGME